MQKKNLALFNLTKNKAGYTATEVACGWAGAIFEVTGAYGQKQFGQKAQKRQKSSVMDGPTDGPTNGPAY